MKRTVLFLLALILMPSLAAQIQLRGYNEALIHPELYTTPWKARWISLPGEPQNVYGVYHFRKTVDLPEAPESCVVHVSGDNRYKLYVNGQLVALGPARGDVYNWNFETVDLAPYLRQGKNVLAAVVWNYAEQKPAAQISLNKTGFILQGNTEKEAVFNTNATWICQKNKAYAPWWDWTVLGYYVAGPGELLQAAAYPWGWEQPDYDDQAWLPAAQGREGAMKGSRDYPERLLVPSPIPPMEYRKERFDAVRLAEGINCPQAFPAQPTPLTIPANRKVRLLLDHKQLTTGYLSLLFSKGRNAEIRIGYAEALYLANKEATTKSYHLNPKQNRDVIDDKLFIGYEDKILPDGGDRREFTTLWWRTWRYVNLEITTADEPLVLDDIYGTFSAYPFENATAFSAPGHEELNRMLDIGWRTARLCANETYMDCPYYEQLQYFGDTRIQAMITLYNTRDPYMVKNALEQGRQSMVADGITMSRYPSAIHQFISSFSLWWIQMGHDYWMHRGDEAYMKTLLPAFRNVLSWYAQWLRPDYSLNYVPHWFFADWAGGFDYGEPVREKEGNSAFQDLLYLMTLDAAAEMEQHLGSAALGEQYKQQATSIRQTIRTKYWNARKGLFADTFAQESFSQHVNALAILAGIVEGDEAKEVMKRTLTDDSLIQATIYFRYYLNQALAKAGLGDQYFDNLQIWRDQMALGLTTWAEMPEPARSDCHAWGASPNIEFYRIVLGIRSASPGFEKIHFAPALGELKEVSGTIPHPKGNISASYIVTQKGQLIAAFELPADTSGEFVWKDKKYALKAGKQRIITEF
ncbi:alpha-L-rhamnosidase C-terminal domain-containing protein [Parabacteroides sp. PF5-6]|uniref:alpha-L-rhamnosidase-related protein n=1 Tax=Parabacteroides sp. PF5-6 TaxID=1742403 RepID=UPI002405E992|nr:alpha-L-rhamnosidase C-terminal domain-containing protein [Parabacteroides sp. PF5-6]MDF9830706.1 alpha-L-rhamnosidase [Parabacteroides sp. PF5-6]